MSLHNQPLLVNLSPFSRVLFSILLMISCFGIVFFLALVIAGPVFGIDIMKIMGVLQDFTDPGARRIIEYFQIVQTIGLFLLPPVIAGFLFSGNSFRYLRLDHVSKGFALTALLTLILIFASMPFVNWLVTMNEDMNLPSSLRWMEDWMRDTEEQAAALTEMFMKMDDPGQMFFNLLLIAILPAFAEEFLFRGLFQRLFHEWIGNRHFAVIVASILFSALHLQFYGFIPRFVLGLILGYLFLFSGTLWMPILAHFIQNGSVVVISYLGSHGIISGDYENFGTTSNPLLITLSAGAIFIILFLIFTINSKDPNQSPADQETGP